MITHSSVSSLRGLAPDEAAAQWIVLVDGGQLSDRDQAEFEAWRAESEVNAAAFARAEAAWNLFEGADGDPTLGALRASALATEREPRRGLWLGAGAAAGIAASLLMAVTFNAGSLPFLGGRQSTVVAQKSGSTIAPARNAPDRGEFVTAKGERRTIRLADGSTLTLNTDSAIRVGFTSTRRLVRLLKGQALFEVAKNPHRPFVVQAADQQVTALGTIFEVRLDADRMKVTLVEGKVVVDGIHDRPGSNAAAIMVPTVLAPGEELVAVNGAKPQLAKVDVDQQLSWLEGFVEFKDVPLANAVQEMNRYSARPLVIGDAATGDLRVSGLFRTGNPERFAAIVGELLPIRQRSLPDGGVELGATR